MISMGLSNRSLLPCPFVSNEKPNVTKPIQIYMHKRKGDRSSPMICGCLFPYFATLKVKHRFLLHDNLLRHYTPQHIISYFLSLMAHTSKLTSLCHSLLIRDQNDIQVLGVCCSVSEEFGKND